MAHDMDTATCPSCGGDTVRGMILLYARCGRCLKAEFMARRAERNRA